MKRPKVKLQKVGEAPGFEMPRYMSAAASGMDLHAALEASLTLQPMERALIPCGFSLELPEGFEGQVRPRSGLAIRQGLTCLNTPGTIDQDYRGELKVILINLGQEAVTIQSGDRIAQLVIAPVVQAELEQVETLGETDRGAGGFGSTGHAKQKSA